VDGWETFNEGGGKGGGVGWHPTASTGHLIINLKEKNKK